MKLSYACLSLVALMLVTACSETPKKQPLSADVQAKKLPPKPPSAAQQPPVKPLAPGNATYALEGGSSHFNAEALTPSFKVEPIVAQATDSVPAATVPQAPAAVVNPVTSAPMPAMPTVANAIAVATAQPALQMAAIAVEDARAPSGTSPAIVALLGEVEQKRAKNDWEGAVVVLERALRIDARNPTLTYQLAQTRLKQAKPQLAEELAGKAALLAGSDLELKRKSWLLIAESRRLQGNIAGANEAKTKAASFFGR
jgi:hypothetical protein